MPRSKRQPVKRSMAVTRQRRSYPRPTTTRMYKSPSTYIRNNTSIAGMGDGKVVKMFYSDFSSFVSTSGVHSFGTFYLTSIYDPLASGSGTNHQPYGYDQYSVFYKKYLVLGAKVTSTFSWTTNAATRPVLCYSVLDEDNTLPSEQYTKKERYPDKCKMLLPDFSKSVTITNKYSAAQWHKINKEALTADHQLASLYGSNPAKPVYLNQGIQTMDMANTSNSVNVVTNIEYVVKLLDPAPIGGS